MIRAGAGLGEFEMDHTQELVQYAVRRGLISSAEGDELLEEVAAVAPKKGKRRSTGTRKAVRPAAKKKTVVSKGAKKKPPAKAKATKKVAKKPAKTTAKRTKRR
jgi:hypothetical protein